jgi:hypothetical protein
MFRLPERKYWRYALDDWWRNLAVRKWINDNPTLAIRVSIASFVVPVIMIICFLWPSSEYKVAAPPTKAWFYDLNTGKLFTAKTGLTPPIAAPSGPLPDGRPAGVKAFVLSYVAEPNEAERFIGFFQTTESASPKPIVFVRTLEDANWIPLDTPQGHAIIQEPFRPDERGEMPHIYSPK